MEWSAVLCTETAHHFIFIIQGLKHWLGSWWGYGKCMKASHNFAATNTLWLMTSALLFWYIFGLYLSDSSGLCRTFCDKWKWNGCGLRALQIKVIWWRSASIKKNLECSRPSSCHSGCMDRQCSEWQEGYSDNIPQYQAWMHCWCWTSRSLHQLLHHFSWKIVW